MKFWNTITQGNTVVKKMIILHYYLNKPMKLVILNTKITVVLMLIDKE